MTEDTSPENLRKFQESDDPAMRMMGLSMAKGAGVPEELLPTILRLYMWDGENTSRRLYMGDEENTIRAAAKSVFNKHAPAEIQTKVKKNWPHSLPDYTRNLSLLGQHGKALDELSIYSKAVRPLVQAFKSQNDFTSIALMPLIKALGDQEFEVRQYAIETLDKFGWVPECDNQRAAYLIAKAQPDAYEPTNLESLLEWGEPAVKPLIKALEKDYDYYNDYVPAIAATALGKIGDERAVEPLIKALTDTETLSERSQSVRCTAAWALGEIGGDRAIEALIKVLVDYRNEVRASAAIALGKIGDKRAVEPLIKMLRPNKMMGHSVGMAAMALGKIGDVRAVGPLIKSLTYVRWINSTPRDIMNFEAADALGEIGNIRAVQPLIEVLKLAMGWNDRRNDKLDTIKRAKETLKKLGHEVE